ncbi:MAG: DUF21 domain-containing protein [Nitriliruptorales bacterium]|nr:DUF21 domain-containing protein [Nitriliruptorales bacterium]
MPTALGLLAVLALILANGYFVAGEFAFVAVRRGRLEELAQEGTRGAVRAIGVHRELSFMLSGAQLGITVTSLVVGFVAEPTLGRALAPVAQLVGLGPSSAAGVALTAAFILATGTQMVLGELAPKNLAIAQPEAFALRLAPSISFYTRLARPVIRLFDGSASALLRAVGIEPVDELGGGVSEDELEYIISESSRGGTLDETTARLLSRSLEFRSLRAGDAMVPRMQIDYIGADAAGADLRALAMDSGHSRFPVTTDGNLDDVVGFVEAKDLLGVPSASRDSTPIRVLLKPVLAVPESMPLGPLLTDMRERHTQLAVVIDEYGGTTGIVTLEDIVEELVGNIEDEYDRAEPKVRRLEDGTFLVPGTWRVDEAERDTRISLPEGDYETVGGLVMERLGRVPEAGDVVALESATLTVDAMDGMAVGRVRVAPRSGGTRP